MNQDDNTTSLSTMLLTFMAGAAIGAVIVALVTPKSGPELRGDLKDAAARAKRKAEALAKDAAASLDDLKERSRLAAADLKRGLADSVAHLKQPAQERASSMAQSDGWDGEQKG